ncbi:MAG: hypothetical protein LKE46_01780 [Clostridium sp.]|jgi:hypothetical protein|uniref:hypothetical protein n=1 Tax=Clostridium sp. TaxID=1506 RepID=UPI0025C6AFA8|nr:hypothetical protein [Clostridium sp.]MCH3962980.1 hypothetical protein [Clostridium sp.]MCI1800189.1 hypothetical protein [Clostridium sp.]MCI2202059.1 hypothetical protein [Clostridium sp.]
MNKIKKFIRKNKCLSIGAIISFCIIFLYRLTDSCPDILWGLGDFIFKLSSDLGLAYFGSFIFYIIQVYIPREDELYKINQCIKIPIDEIINGTKRITIELDLNKKFCDISDESTIYTGKNVIKEEYFNYIFRYIEEININSQSVFVLAKFLDSDLILALNGIVNSKYFYYFRQQYDNRYDKSCRSLYIKTYKNEMIECYKNVIILENYARKNSFKIDRK